MPSWELPKEINLQTIFKFLAIREENGFDFPRDLNHFKLIFMKSALFNRMANGIAPLPIPPPKSYSYPWYNLIEDGVASPFEVWEPSGVDLFTNYNSIVIDQSPWKVIDKIKEDEWIVTYPYGKEVNNEQKFAEGKWHVYCIGCRIPPDNFPSSNKLWEIKKIE